MSDLILKSLRIENFKAFTGEHDIALDRKPGLYYITGMNKVAPELGANGVGKSTIWDALLWVLFDRTGRDNRPADAVKPWAGRGRTLVQLEFIRGSETYSLIRARNPNVLSVLRHGDAGEKDITQKDVPALLGMTEEMFRRTMVLGQFGTLFLDLKPEAQAQMFTEALDLDVWLRAADIAGKQASAATRAADTAMADQAANARALQTISGDIEDAQKRADVFEQDRTTRIRRGEDGVASLEEQLIDAQNSTPPKPQVPVNKDTLSDKRATASTHLRMCERREEELARESKKLADELADLDTVKNCRTCGQPLKASGVEESRARINARAKALFAERKDAATDTKRAFDDLQRLIDAQEEQRKAYDKELRAYQPKLDAYEKAIRAVASIQGELRRWRDQLETVRNETNTAADEKARLLRRRTQLRGESSEITNRLEQAQRDQASAEFWREGFKLIRLQVIDEALLELEIAASRHVGMLGLVGWGVKLDTARETKAGTTSYSFTVLLYPPGQDKPVKWESYSGGESQRWQLAFAFALSEVLLSRAGLAPNIEVLDEPTRGLSATGVADLLEHLRDRAIELGRAIYFCDHHSLSDGSFDGTLVVTKTKKGSAFEWK